MESQEPIVDLGPAPISSEQHSFEAELKDYQGDTVIVPNPAHQISQRNLWRNKLALIFECELRYRQVQDWIVAYNQENVTQKLTYVNELQNSIYVVRLETPSESADQLALVNRSPIKALHLWASVNVYNQHFDPSQPKGWRHMVTIHIEPANPVFQEYLRFVVQPVGRLVRERSSFGTRENRITAPDGGIHKASAPQGGQDPHRH
jgi:hypothetical protein